MESYITMILTTSLVMSAIVLGLILFNRFYSGKYPAKWRYYIWLIVIVGLLVPFRPNIELPFNPVQVPVFVENTPLSEMADISDADNTADTNFNAGGKLLPADTKLNIASVSPTRVNVLSQTAVIFWLWLIGALVSLIINLWQHKKFIEITKRWGTDITDERILTALRQAQSDLNISQKNIRIKTCKTITSPMLAGFIRPTILLPDKPIHDDELPLILKHELVHYKRKDLWVNLLVVFTTAVHWFNPIVYIMSSMIRNDCEISCDEMVLGDTGIENRRIYGEAIIGVIGTKKAVKTALSTNFYGGKNTMKKRIMSIMNTTKKRKWIAVLCGILVFTATVLSGSVLALNAAEITLEEAQEIALAETNGGTVVKYKLEYENGIKVYEIEIVNGDTKYEIEVGVKDSKIYKSESKSVTKKNSTALLPSDTDITIDEAKQIALEKAGGGEVIKWELDYEDGIKVYEIEIIDNINIKKYSMDVSAIDGTIYNYKEKLILIKSETTSNSVSPNVPSDSTITLETAKKIALEKVGGGTIKDWELDYEKGTWIYEIEVVYNGVEHEVEINAGIGEIIKYEIDDEIVVTSHHHSDDKTHYPAHSYNK